MSAVVIQDSRNQKTKIKVTPGMAMRDVLVEYCKEKELDDKICTLLHKGKALDLSLPFRLTGLSNNATLTLGQRSATAAVAVVTVALQLDEGTRVQSRLRVDASLWLMLKTFDAGDTRLNLTQRLQPKPAEEKKPGFLGLSLGASPKEGPVGYMQPVVTLLNKRFSTYAELSSTTLESLGLRSGSCLVRVTHEWTESPVVPAEALAEVDLSASQVVVATTAASSSPTPPPTTENTTPESNVKVEEESSSAQESSNSNNNDNNAPVVTTPAVVVDSSVSDRPSKAQKTEEVDGGAAAEEPHIPEDRNVVVFQPSDTPFNPANYEVPDDFYDLSPSDFSALKSAAGKRDDEPLMTREFREKKALTAFQKFSKTNIRVRFPDRWELQGTFLASEGTVQLYDFVKKYVAQPDREFVLYTTPPKMNLENSSFVRQKLVPASVVYFSWSGRQEGEAFLSEEAKAKALVIGTTEHHLSTFSNPKLVKDEPPASASSSSGKGKEEANGPMRSSTKKTGGGGVPSWLKMGKK